MARNVAFNLYKTLHLQFKAHLLKYYVLLLKSKPKQCVLFQVGALALTTIIHYKSLEIFMKPDFKFTWYNAG